MVCGQQGGTDQNVVFRAVHVAERQIHQVGKDGIWVAGSFAQADADDLIDAVGVAFIAYEMAVDAAGGGNLFLMADGALHLNSFAEVFQRRLAD